MPFYNLVSDKHRLIVSVQPKCGCRSLISWFEGLEGKKEPLHRVNTNEILSEKYRDYEKVLVIRDPYSRLISYYCRFVIDPGNQYDGLWIHADAQKNIALSNTSFFEFIQIMNSLETEAYQHHLEPQTVDCDPKDYDQVLNIVGLSAFVDQKSLPPLGWLNKLNRVNYQRSVIHDKPEELRGNNIEVPSYDCFLDDNLLDIVVNGIYPNDYRLLGDYLRAFA